MYIAKNKKAALQLNLILNSGARRECVGVAGAGTVPVSKSRPSRLPQWDDSSSKPNPYRSPQPAADPYLLPLPMREEPLPVAKPGARRAIPRSCVMPGETNSQCFLAP